MKKHNQSIQSLELVTPNGGETEYRLVIDIKGRLDYEGIRNVERMGRHRGTIGTHYFDNLATIVDSEYFKNCLWQHDNDPRGNNKNSFIIVSKTQKDTDVYQVDAYEMPPVFWAVLRLMKSVLYEAKWGQIYFDQVEDNLPRVIERTDGLSEDIDLF